MKRVIAGINITLDGICDHTAIPADEELHQHFSLAVSPLPSLFIAGHGGNTYKRRVLCLAKANAKRDTA
jgi:hypothetical protein